MELIQSAMRRSHSRDSARSRKSEEGTTARHGHHSQDPIYQNEGNNDCDDNYSVLGSEDSILPKNFEQTKNDPIGKILLDIAHDQTMLAKKCKLENMKFVKILKNSWTSAKTKTKTQ
jgi:hypothetical protein